MPNSRLPRHESPDYFVRQQVKQRPWIIQGVVREHQITTIGGAFNKGKSPLVQEWAIHVCLGLTWCGRKCSKRPVILFDFETQEDDFRISVSAICERLGVQPPRLYDDLIPFLAQGDKNNPYTQRLNNATDDGSRLILLRDALTTHPNALISFDPIELYFDFGEVRKTTVREIYKRMRSLLNDFSQAAFLDTHNLRKLNRTGDNRPDLLTNPHEWLEEVCGSLDVMNRSDNRLGIDLLKGDGEIRVINGVVRGGGGSAILIKPTTLPQPDEDNDPTYSGWEWVSADAITIRFALPQKMHEGWASLPKQFRYSEVVPDLLTNGTWIRLKKKAMSLGILRLDEDNTYHKVESQGELIALGENSGRNSTKVQ